MRSILRSPIIPLQLAALLGLMTGTPGPVHAQDSVIITADSNRATLRQGGRNEPFTLGTAIRVKKGVPLPVTVVGRNSALYACTETTEAVPDPDRAALMTWLAGLKNYLSIAAGAGLQTKISYAPDTSEIPGPTTLLEDYLSAFDTRLHGSHGMVAARLRQLTAIGRLGDAKNDAKGITSAVQQYQAARGNLGCEDGECPRVVLDLLTGIDTAARKVRAGMGALREKAYPDPPIPPTRNQRRDRLLLASNEKLLEAAAAVIAETDNIRALALSTVAWHQRITSATDRLQCGNFVVTADSGRKVTIKVAPIEAAETANLGLEKGAFETGFTATAARGFRLGVGLSLLRAAGARYPSFGTVAADGGMVKVVAKGEQDLRVNYGLTLGFALGPSNTMGKDRLVWWPAELLVVPSDNVRAFGIGTAVSFNVVKVGAGLLWARHDVLAEPITLSSLLPNADALATVTSFGKAKFYLSLSLVGLPPFTP
ncbi:MAG: hypothetical protein ACKVZ0_16095 [Gemmatimonadales bacterium]